MQTAPEPRTIAAELAFTKIEDVSVDDARRGLLRARTLEPAARVDPRSYDLRTCSVIDGSAAGVAPPDLHTHGFSHVDLGDRRELQAALARVRAAGRLDAADAQEIRRRLVGRSLRLASGGRLWLLHIAREGFFMRRAGPNGMPLPRTSTADDHDAAVAVHADQDVEGTPLRQILRGAAPWLFRHESPDRSNRNSRLTLVNVWIPLDQVTRPLALMDRRTLDRRAHQLRHGLVTDGIFKRERDQNTRVNDVWTFLHDASQRWYFASELDHRRAYVFETLSTPHGSFILPGEERAEALHRRLVAAVEAVGRSDAAAARRALESPAAEGRAPATASLARAISAMETLVAEGLALVPALCRGEDPSQWSARATAAASRVVRKSIEMRAIAVLSPSAAPG